MKHLGTVTLESDRLLLRRFTMEDATAMFNNWANDKDVTKYLMWPAHESVRTSKGVLMDWTSQYNRDDYYQWAITLKEYSDEPIGCIGVVEHNDRIESSHIGYCIGKSWWHQGITTEAMKMVIDFLLHEVHMNRVESRFDPRNPHSGGVMKKAGMQYEGTYRQADWNNQGICDASYYSILASDHISKK